MSNTLKVGDIVKITSGDRYIEYAIGSRLMKRNIILNVDRDIVTVIAENGWVFSDSIKAWNIGCSAVKKIDCDDELLINISQFAKDFKVFKLSIEMMASDILKNYNSMEDQGYFISNYLNESHKIVNGIKEEVSNG